MAWNNSNGGAEWEATADSAWSTTQAAPAVATAIHQPGIGIFDASVESPAQCEDNAADGSQKSAAAAKGANPEWTGHEQSRYDYDGFIVRDGEYEGNARIYHWDGDEGDIGPEFPELELEIFGPPDQRGEVYGPDIAK